MRTTRRALIKRGALLGLTGAASLSLPSIAAPNPAKGDLIQRRVATSQEFVPAVGMGSWRTFDVGDSAHARGKRVEILREFFAHGGSVIDSSPMYGTSQLVIGHCLDVLANEKKKNKESFTPFCASKVWTPGRVFGKRQMKNSADLWRVPSFDLMQIHNLLDWDTHIETLKEWKAAGRVKYIGVTTSHGRRHEKLVSIMQNEPIDFVQITYNIADREAEKQLLPLALERGISVIVNRPFQGSLLFDKVRGKALPEWAREFGCDNWAQYFLKFIVSHRAVTCAIPATSKLTHMTENMGALVGELPNPKTRRKMVSLFEEI